MRIKRPKELKTQAVTAKIEQGLYLLLLEKAVKERISVSEAVRVAIKNFIK